MSTDMASIGFSEVLKCSLQVQVSVLYCIVVVFLSNSSVYVLQL